MRQLKIKMQLKKTTRGLKNRRNLQIRRERRKLGSGAKKMRDIRAEASEDGQEIYDSGCCQCDEIAVYRAVHSPRRKGTSSSTLRF